MDVYSYDFWDTLFGRRYYTSRSVFEQIYKELPLQDFVERRIWSEHHTPINTLSGIYDFYRDHFKEDQLKLDVLLRKEYGYEFETSFPIYDVIAQLKTPYILVSDFYMDKYFFLNVLERHGIIYPIDFFVGWDGKSTGRVWNEVKKKYNILEHWGDNPSSDVSLARANGVNGLLYPGSKFTETEDYLRGAGFQNLACLLRMLRLSNPHPNNTIGKDLWNDQVLNVGVLILFSAYINKYKGSKKILFTQRDCNLLMKMYQSLYPNDTFEAFHTSRDLYINPVGDFVQYCKELDAEEALIVDLQGTGESCYAFFQKWWYTPPNYLTLIDSDRQRRNFQNKSHVVRWDDGYSDNIESLNYDVVGRLLSIENGYPIREEANKEHLPYIKLQHNCVNKALELLREFDLDLGPDLKSGIVILLKKMEKGIRMRGVVPHNET